MTVFEKNRAAITSVTPEVAPLLDVGPDPEFEVEPSAAGCPTARRNGVYIHSKRDPVREAERAVDAGIAENAATIVVLGFGLGYQAEAALDRYPDATVVVVEPSVPAFIAAIRARDMAGMLANRRFVLLLAADPGAVPQILRTHDAGETSVLSLRGLRTQASEPYWSSVDAAIASYRHRREINRNTLIRFGKLWVRNLARNLDRFADARPVRDLQGTLPGVPALVLGAGPSLDDVLPHLEDLSRRMTIIAVDTALGPCLDAGVEPDFLVVVDPQYWNTRHLDRRRTDRTILISESSTHGRVFEILADAPTYFCSSLFPLGEYLEETLGERGRLGAGGSVSTTAWDFARLLGGAPIVNAGVDLGFPGRATHCRGSFFEERTHLVGSRLEPAETLAFAYLYDADPYLVEATDESQVLTDKRMVIYRWWFENQTAMHSEIDARTTSRGGVKVRGIEYVSPQALLSLPVLRPSIEQRLAAHRLPSSPAWNRRKLLAASIHALDAALKELEKAAAEALEIVEQAAGAPAGEVADILRRLDEVDESIYASRSRRIPSFLMQDVIADLTESATADPIESSRRLYSSLLESVRYHRRYISA